MRSTLRKYLEIMRSTLRKYLWVIVDEAFFLPLVLLQLGLLHGMRLLGLEWPYLESRWIWALSDEPALSAWLALVSLGAMAVVCSAVGSPWQRRLLAALLLAIATGVLYRRAPQVGGLWGLQALYLVVKTLRFRTPPRDEAAPPPKPLVTGPSASDRVTLAAALAGVLLAVGVTFVVGRAFPDLVLPLTSPADRFPNSHRSVSAEVVALGPLRGGEAALVPHPSLTREQVLAGVRDQGGGWTVGRPLLTLERRKQLEGLPPTEPGRAASLLEPVLATGILRTRDGQPALERGLWGVVIEAEHWKGARRALLSLGLGEPTGLPATRYELLLEWPASGGVPQVIAATRFVPRPSGFEGVEWPGIFLPVLLACLLLTLGLALVWNGRGKGGAQGSATGAVAQAE